MRAVQSRLINYRGAKYSTVVFDEIGLYSLAYFSFSFLFPPFTSSFYFIIFLFFIIYLSLFINYHLFFSFFVRCDFILSFKLVFRYVRDLEGERTRRTNEHDNIFVYFSLFIDFPPNYYFILLQTIFSQN